MKKGTRITLILLCVSIFILTACAAGQRPFQTKNEPSSPLEQTGFDEPNEAKAEDTDQQTQGQTTIESIGYLEPTDPERAVSTVNNLADHLTYVAFFSYRIKSNGDLIPLKDQTSLDATRQTTAKPMLVITNFADGTFSPQVAHSILTDEAKMDRLIDNVIEVMKAKGYRALNIDFEHIQPQDRDRYTGFLKRITSRVKKAGYPVSTALAPKMSGEQTGPWYGAHDYGAHAKIVDFVILMTYEWGWTGGPPMAVAPIEQVRKVLDYAVSVIPREKIVMGAPLYGYDWVLPYRKGGTPAKRIGPQEAAELAESKGVKVQYDRDAQAPFFRYKDEQGKDHVVWFENEQSMQAKFDLIKEYRLRGISYWELGVNFPQNWSLLEKNFQVKKQK